MKNEDILSKWEYFSQNDISKGKMFLFRKMKILFEKSLFHSCRKKETNIKETFIFIPKKKIFILRRKGIKWKLFR